MSDPIEKHPPAVDIVMPHDFQVESIESSVDAAGRVGRVHIEPRFRNVRSPALVAHIVVTVGGVRRPYDLKLLRNGECRLHDNSTQAAKTEEEG